MADLSQYSGAARAVTRSAPTGAAPAAAKPMPAPAASGTAGYLPMVQSPIYGDPSMLAFMRASGLSNEIAAADVARQTANQNMALGIATDDIVAQGEIGRRNIAGSHEARGVYRSGAQLRAQSEQEAAQSRALGAARLGTASTIGGLQSQLLQTIAGNQQRATELGLSTASEQARQRRLAEEGLL